MTKYTFTGNVVGTEWQSHVLPDGSAMSDVDIKWNRQIAKQIMESKSPAEAKRLGSQFRHLDVTQWNNQSSGVMKQLILESFKQNPDAAKRLIETGNAELTHKQDRGKWGKEFPKILTEIRSELQNEQSSQPTSDYNNTTEYPDDAMKTCKGK